MRGVTDSDLKQVPVWVGTSVNNPRIVLYGKPKTSPKLFAGLQSKTEVVFGKKHSLLVFWGTSTKAWNLESHISLFILHQLKIWHCSKTETWVSHSWVFVMPLKSQLVLCILCIHRCTKIFKLIAIFWKLLWLIIPLMCFHE